MNFVALAIKGVEYDYKPVHLVKDGGQQVCVNMSTCCQQVMVMYMYFKKFKNAFISLINKKNGLALVPEGSLN